MVKDSFYFTNLKDMVNPELIRIRDDSIVVTKDVINVKAIANAPKGHILFQGIGQEVDLHNNYLFNILKADDSSYSVNLKTGQYHAFGGKIKLVTGYQVNIMIKYLLGKK